MATLKMERSVSGSNEVIAIACDDDGKCIGSAYVPDKDAAQVWFDNYIALRNGPPAAKVETKSEPAKTPKAPKGSDV